MSGFDDLVNAAQPKVWATESTEVTENRSWVFPLVGVIDAGGVAIDFTGLTGECRVYDKDTRASVTTLAFAGKFGGFTLTSAAASNAGTAGDFGVYPRSRPCYWSLKVTLADGRVVQLWGPDDEFVIHQEGPTS